MDKDKKYVDNNVFKFRLYLDRDFTEIEDTVYTHPEIHDADKVKAAYYDEARIEEYKNRIIEKIRKTKNPFTIQLADLDGGYNVTEEELFEM